MRRTAALGVAAVVAAAAPVLTATAPADPGATPPVVTTPAPVPGPPAEADTARPATAAPGPSAATADPDVGAGADADADTGAPPHGRSREGFLVAAGGAAAGRGPLLRYTVEVDPATGADPAAVAAVAETALGDVRSWGRQRRLVRVDDPDAADARLVLAPPDVVDALCAEAGLDTAGVYSCWNGRIVALNAWRWATGAYGFPDVATYRLYLVNHEVGHVLGYGHVACPAPGATAPLMMQQSKGLDGCTANGWPHP